MRVSFAALAAVLVSGQYAYAQTPAPAAAAENKYEIVLVDPTDDEEITGGEHDASIEFNEKLPCFPVTTKPTAGLEVRIAFQGKDPRARSATVVAPGVCLELPVGVHGMLRGCVMSDGHCHVVRDLGKFTVTRLEKPKPQKRVRPGGKSGSSKKKAALKPLEVPLGVSGGTCYDSDVYECVGATGKKRSGKCSAYVKEVILCPTPGRVLLASADPPVDQAQAERDDAQDARIDGQSDRIGDIERHVTSRAGNDDPPAQAVVPSGTTDPCVRERLKSRFFVPDRKPAARAEAAKRECEIAHRERTGTSH